MRWIRKVNKGFAAMILVLLVLISYRIILSQDRKQETGTIERLADDYLATAMDAEFLSAEVMTEYLAGNQNTTDFIESDSYKAYYDRVKSSLSGFYPSDGKYLNYAMNRLEKKWLEQMQSRVIPDFEYNIDEMVDIRYIDDQAALDIYINYTLETDSGSTNSMYYEETMQFIKVNAEWKLLATNFYTNFYQNYRWD